MHIKFSSPDEPRYRAEFRDRAGLACSVQESTLAHPAAIWLGVDSDRMHLTQEQVRDLLPVLIHFAYEGLLPRDSRPAQSVEAKLAEELAHTRAKLASIRSDVASLAARVKG